MSWFGNTVGVKNLPQKKIHGEALKAKAGLVLGAEGMG
jgi:hypothetical protein